MIAEIADVKENRSGHCYLELVEKREEDDAVIATGSGYDMGVYLSDSKALF